MLLFFAFLLKYFYWYLFFLRSTYLTSLRLNFSHPTALLVGDRMAKSKILYRFISDHNCSQLETISVKR